MSLAFSHPSHKETFMRLVIERVRTEDSTDLPATEFFRTRGGYPTSRP
jgi:hypothetical protein